VLSTVLFTDIVDSTKTAVEVGDAEWRRVLNRHDEVSGHAVGRNGGRVVKSTGDGFLATFDGPERALRCAAAVRDDLHGLHIDVRAGLHTGEIDRTADDIAGIAAHVAARVMALAEGGEILATRTVKDLVAGSGLEFESHGVHSLKGVPDEWQLYALDLTRT
jgi:class 3 adenylate cyclase